MATSPPIRHRMGRVDHSYTRRSELPKRSGDLTVRAGGADHAKKVNAVCYGETLPGLFFK